MDEKRMRRLFAAAPEDAAEARSRLGRGDCPRRYCWFWHTLSFDWHLSPADGCGVAEEHPRDLWLRRQGVEVGPWCRCRRATGNPQHADGYEPRGPYLRADGWPDDYFSMVGKAGRRRRFERREHGRRRHEGRRPDE